VLEHAYTKPPWTIDILHLHWPEFDVLPSSARPLDILRTAAVWAWLLLARGVGVRILWTAHNSFPHDKDASGLNLFLWKRFLSILDGVIFLSEDSQRIVTAAYPSLTRLPSAIIRHGHYGPWIETVRAITTVPQPELLRTMEQLTGKFILLHFGQLRPYKNVDGLMREFSLLRDPTIRLLIAGRVIDADQLQKLEAQAKIDDRIVLWPKHLDDASLVACIDRADLVVLPYRKVLNSGSIMMALSFGKHAVAPSIGSLRSLQREVGEGALTLFDGQFDADVLRAAIERVRSNNHVPPDLKLYELPLIASQMIEYYERMTGRSANI
jgi:glycosyltransferase involved in cell wall biosynthesis